MIDTLVLLFSLGMVVFVVVRSAMLDHALPWFSGPPQPDSPARADPHQRPAGPAARARRRPPPA